MSQKTIVCVIGPPGCGKNTQLDKLAAAGLFPATFLSSGDIFRDLEKKNPQLYRRVEPFLTGRNPQKTRLVPDDLLIQIMGPRIARSRGLVFLNGMPRTSEQLDWLLSSYQDARFVLLFLRADLKRCLKRIADRRAKESRLDDGEGDAEERMAEYKLKTIPAIAQAMNRGIVYDVDVKGSIDDANTNFLTVLARALPEYSQVLLEHAARTPIAAS